MPRQPWKALALGLLLLADGAGAAGKVLTTTGRRGHAAIMLRDGSVLVFGGTDDLTAPTGVVERFVPWSGWETLPSFPLAVGMVEPVATMLTDGRVLVVINGARIFTPGTSANAWTELDAGFQGSRRTGHTLTVLQDGRVLLAGGIDESIGDAGYPLFGGPLPDGGWQWVAATNPLPALRVGHTATLLENGGVLLVGGTDPGSAGAAGVNTFGFLDTANNGFRFLDAGFTQTRTGHTATRRLSGDVLVFGQTYDPVASGVKVSPPPGFGPTDVSRASYQMSWGHTAVLLPTGEVDITGGVITGQSIATCSAYDRAGQWSTTNESLLVPRTLHTATLLMDGTELVVGGAAPGSPTTWELRDQIPFVFSETAQQSIGAQGATATPMPSGDLLVVGGLNAAPPDVAMKVTPSGVATSLQAAALVGRTGHTSTLLTSDEVLVLGGLGEGAVALDECWLITLTSPSLWKSCAPMPGPRHRHTATLLANGKVLVAGGFDANGVATPTAWVYDPGAPNGGSWTSVGPLSFPRANHAAVMLPLGRVALIGGGPTGATTEWLLPDGGFTTGYPLNTPRVGPTATLLRDGRVLVAGGRSPDGGAFTSLEVWDPTAPAMGFAPLGPDAGSDFEEPRAFHSAVALPTGDVVFAGGVSGGGDLASRWSPLFDRFETAPFSLAHPRREPAMVLGDHTEVMVLGGSNSSRETMEVQRHFLAADAGGFEHTLTAIVPVVSPNGSFGFTLGGAWRAASQASTGGTRDSSTSLPRLLWQRLDNGEVRVPQYNFNPSAGQFTGQAPADLERGQWRAWAYVSAFPGNAAWFKVGTVVTSSYDAGVPDGGNADGGSTDGGTTDGGTTDGGSTDGGSYSVAVGFDAVDPKYTLVKLKTLLKVSAPDGTPGAEVDVVLSGSEFLELCSAQDCTAGAPATMTLSGTLNSSGVALPPVYVRPAQDGIHTLHVLLVRNGASQAEGSARFESVSPNGTLTPGACGCAQAPGGLLALLALAWSLRKARPRSGQRL